jgi:peptidoglycan/xylan/chitin deacetylase (PgdA/CDA1 family)
MGLNRLLYTAMALFLMALPPLPELPAEESPGTNNEKGGQIRVLVYHRFGMEDKYPSTSVSISQFRSHLSYLERNGYTVLPLGEALNRLYSGKGIPEKTASLTMDDGYQSIWENALPLLQEYGFRATIFVSTGRVGAEGRLSWEQIQKLREKGFEIGNHSHSHAHFLNQGDKRRIADAFRADLEASHEQFRRRLGEVPVLYAYPFGEYTPEMMEILKDSGYRAAAAQRSGVIYSGSRRFALPRFPMNSRYAEMEGFSRKMRMNALPVMGVDPVSTRVKEANPPELRLRITAEPIQAGGIQCFVAGRRACRLRKHLEDGTLFVTVRARHKLESRRTLYTITAPARKGPGWFWFSHLWVNPAASEKY